MSGHTKGPWAYVPTDRWSERIADRILSSDGEIVVRDVEREEDAHLIAAAPELLEALQALLHQALQSDLATEQWGQEAIASARAAIAAATPTTLPTEARHV